MAYYSICPRCGAHNDPGEMCDCRKAEAQAVTAAEAYQAVRIAHRNESAERDEPYHQMQGDGR